MKNVDLIRMQGVCNLIYKFFGTSLGELWSVKFHYCGIYVKDFK